MNTTQQGIVTLLKSAILQKTLPLPEGFCLEEAAEQIRRHNIATLCYDGAVRCGMDPKSEGMQQLFRRYCKALLVSEQQMAQVGRIFAAFDAAGIHYLPLKGCVLKALYPKPELRTMGDADILIRTEQYDRIVPVMEQLGFEAKGESDHELIWRGPGLYLELHKRLIPSYNKDFYAYFGEGWQLAKPEQGSRYAMTPEDTFIFLFTHFAKHFRDGGIGCRYVADLWVYRSAHPQLDEAYITQVLKTLQLDVFYGHICRLLQVWFYEAQTDALTQLLTDYIFDSGVWGAGDSRLLSRTVRDAKLGAGGASGKLTYLWKTAFPDRYALQEKYSVLQKAPWLLPAVWVYRPFYKVLRERNDLHRQKENLQAVSAERMRGRTDFLHSIGLEYHF